MWSNIIDCGSRLRSIIFSMIAMYALTHLMVFTLIPVAFGLMKYFPSITFVADDFLTRLPFISFFLKQIGAIFVDQKNPRKPKSAIDERLKNQNKEIRCLLIYPGGRRAVDDYIGRFRYGFGYILQHGNFDLLPVTASGFYQSKPVKRLYMDPYADLEIKIHEPVAHSEIVGMDKGDIAAKSEEIIKAAYRP